ncbi:ATP-binding protein [Sorangium sp. So ce726]|uniref:ATP-binding protein n=1 Tax=Sorangium sp. So ce726 TaxID=3133319 RepID=UPI003F63E6C4
MSAPRLDKATAQQRGRAKRGERVAMVMRAAMDLSSGPVDVAALLHVYHDSEGLPLDALMAFQDAFVEGVLAHPARHRAWIEALQSAITTCTTTAHALPDERLDSRDQEELEAEARHWQHARDPFFVWEARRYDGPLKDAAGFELDVLLRLDRKAWLEALDALPWPSLMRNTVCQSHIASNRELLIELIRAAPPVFDEEGRWTRSVALLLVAELLRMHADFLGDQGTQTQWLREAYGLLLTRPDGATIACGMLADLSAQHLSDVTRQPQGDESTSNVALETLVESLVHSGVRVAFLHRFWKEREAMTQREVRDGSARRSVRARSFKKPAHIGEGCRQLGYEAFPLLYGSARVLDAAGAPHEELERYWAWLVEILDGRAPGLSTAAIWSHRPQAVQPLARLLARLPAPATAWRTAYARLEPQRRRSQFLVRYEDHDSDEPSLVLVRIGLYACAFLRAVEAAAQPGEDVNAFFWTVYDAVRRLWLTAAVDPSDSRKELVATCFAFMPTVFGDALKDALKRAAPPIATEPWLVCLAAHHLTQNGVEPRRVAEFLAAAGADLVCGLQEVFTWASLTGVKDDFLPAFKTLAGAIDLTLPDEVPETAEQRHARHEALFVQRVPWGKEMLNRLQRDGCTPVRIEPLNELSTTWLIQARASAQLRETFALAPELRILAATGGFDGRDILRAAEYPAGSSEIDPDLLLIATERRDLTERLLFLPGPWGQRIPWVPVENVLPPLIESIRLHARDFDLFSRVDPVHGRALMGREDEISRLSSRLLRGDAVGLFGLSKVGKSSLLQAVAERFDPVGAPQALIHFTPALEDGALVQALVVALDVQNIADVQHPAGQGLDKLLFVMVEQLRDRLLRAAPHAVLPERQTELLDDFERLLQLALAIQPLPICFILDECDLLFEDHLGEHGIWRIEKLFERLRRIAQHTQRVSLALVGRDPGPLLRSDRGTADNPLRSYCEISWLGPLRRDESDDLLTRLCLRVGLTVGSMTKEAAWASTGGFPVLLRQYGSALLEAVKRDQPDSQHVVHTDVLCAEAAMLVRQRALVLEAGREIRTLLARSSPPALVLFQELTAPSTKDPGKVVAAHDGWEGSAAKHLQRYGLLTGSAEMPRIPEALRPRGAHAPPVRTRAVQRRRARHGA